MCAFLEYNRSALYIEGAERAKKSGNMFITIGDPYKAALLLDDGGW